MTYETLVRYIRIAVIIELSYMQDGSAEPNRFILKLKRELSPSQFLRAYEIINTLVEEEWAKISR